MSWLIVDLETENKEYLGSKVSPFCPENYIVAPAYAINDGPVRHWYFNNRAEADASDWINGALEESMIFVAHNATMEIHWLLHRHYDAFMAFLKKGGRIFCTQYAEYLLSHQTETYPALGEVALRYGGTAKIDEVKMMWEQGFTTSQIPRDLLLEYLAGPEGDIENTRKVCFGQYAKLVANDMLAMFWHRMDALLFNAISTFNGLFIDLSVAHKNHAEQLTRAEELREQVFAMLPEDCPRELREQWNFGSDYHMSAFLFGGPIKYDVKVPYDPPKFEKGDFYKLDAQYIPVDAITEEQMLWVDRYKAGKQKGLPKVHRIDTTTPKLKWGEAVYHFDGLINLRTLPPHVQEQYLGKRAEFRGKRFLCDREVIQDQRTGKDIVVHEGTPVFSTGKDSLDVLANFTDAAKPLKELAQLDKDNGTYYITYEYDKDGNLKKTKGMLQYVDTNNIIHHSLNGTSTITTRLSSSNPNLQNLPRDGTSKVKEMFASRFGSSGRIVEVDYTALEVVTLAAISNDQNLLDKLLSGTDMHCYRLAAKLHRDYDELVAIVADKNHPEHKSIKQQRTDIKPPSFAAQYGASAAGISYATGCTIEYAEEFLALEAKLFPQSIAYRQVVREEVEASGSIAPVQREFNEITGWSAFRRGSFKSKGSTHYSFRTYPQWREGQEVQDYKPTQLANYWCQGEASFIVQCATGNVIRWLIENDFFGGCVLPINTVHDAIYLDCVNEEWACYAGAMVKKIMEETPKAMCTTMPSYREWRYDTTPFPAAAEQGLNMMDKEHI